MSEERVIRFATAAVVCAVAAVAAVVSYSHIYAPPRQDARRPAASAERTLILPLPRAAHEPNADAPGCPLMLCSSHDRREHRLRCWIRPARRADLGLARGRVHRFGGDRHAARARPRGPQAATAVPEVPGNVEQAVRAAYAASVAAGAPMSQRAMAERFGLSRRRISQLIAEATGIGNGDLRGSAA